MKHLRQRGAAYLLILFVSMFTLSLWGLWPASAQDVGEDIPGGDTGDVIPEEPAGEETPPAEEGTKTPEGETPVEGGETEGGETPAEGEEAITPEGELEEPSGPPSEPLPRGGERLSLLDYYTRGGFFMHPILFCQIAVFSIILESCFTLNVFRVIPGDLVKAIEKDLDEGKIDAAITKCEENPTLAANVMKPMLAIPPQKEQDAIDAIELAGEVEGEGFLSHAAYMSIFGVIAPMLGLLGTVQGIIMAFQRVAFEAALGKPEQLADGIYTALLTTAFGLIVGIPAMFMYYYFRNRGIRILLTVETSLKRFIKWRATPGNTGRPKDGIFPRRLTLGVDEALSNAFVGLIPIVGFFLGPFAIAKSMRFKTEFREAHGNPSPTAAAKAASPDLLKATWAFILGIVDIAIWPVAGVVYWLLFPLLG